MNEEIKKKWVAALRSGEYVQGNGVLYDAQKDAYCCLGVLCVVSDISPDDIEGEEYPDPITAREIGLPDKYGTLPRPYVLAYETLADFNDSGVPFSEIADVIEAQL